MERIKEDIIHSPFVSTQQFIFKVFVAGVLSISLCSFLKEEIAIKEKALELASSDAARAQLNYQLAMAYAADQEPDKAFIHFLQALTQVESRQNLPLLKEEKEIYEKALADYRERAGNDPTQAAQELLKDYGKIADANPQFLHLNFLISTAYANLNKYEVFFERFYKGYPFLKDSFLAYKIQGILYLRLAGRTSSEYERALYQNEAHYYLERALEKDPQDGSIYKVLIFLAKDAKKGSCILTYLQNLVECQAKMTRSDICYYVQEAVLLEEYELAQKIIDYARRLYAYSRGISAAQEYLNGICHGQAASG